MRRGFIIIVGVCCVTIVQQAFSQGSEEIWKKLNEAMQREIAATDETKTDTAPKRVVAGELRRLMSSRDENVSVQPTITEVDSAFHSPEVLRLAIELRAAMDKEHDARNAARLEKVNSAIKHAADAVHSAKEPRDLDAVIRELRDTPELHDDRSPELRSANGKLQDARQFVIRWQDYLWAARQGDAKHAIELLRNVGNSGSRADLMPRSELLALVAQRSGELSGAPTESVDEILGKVKMLADVAEAIRQLHALETHRQQLPSGANVDEVRQAITALTPIDKTYREFMAGFPTTVEAALNPGDQTPGTLAPLRTQLLMLMLPRFLSLPPDIKPQAGEPVAAFVERVANIARDRGDVRLLERTREARGILSHGHQPGNGSGLAFLMAAENQEAAGHYMLAVISYNNALKNGDEDISPTLIGQKLNAIKAAHPQDYERGLSLFLNPQHWLEYPPMPGPPRPAGVAPVPNPALSVPAVAPKPGATPATQPTPKPGG